MQNLQQTPRGLFAGRKGRVRRETLTAYLFLLPAILIIFVFGLWPVAHAFYVSLHKWNIKPKGLQCLPYWFASLGLGSGEAAEQTDCLGLNNYVQLLGLQDTSAIIGTILAVILGIVAYRLWTRARQASKGSPVILIAAAVVALIAAYLLVRAIPGLVESGEWTYLVSAGLLILAWLIWKGAGMTDSTLRLILRWLAVIALISSAMFFFFVDFQRMWDLGNQEFFRSLIYTV